MRRERERSPWSRTLGAVAWIWVFGVLAGYMVQFRPIIEHMMDRALKAFS